MQLPESFGSPTVVSAIVAGIVAVVTLVTKLRFDKRETREGHRYTDRERLSMDEHQFRLTLIQDLTECRKGFEQTNKSYRECERRSMRQERQISGLQIAFDKLCFEVKKLDPDFDVEECRPKPEEEQDDGRKET